ncbi:hypothetical protein Q4Q35_10820 [Flavivirga aquimarina]|uniref:Uncharacterized protein n=1 Tax=Flavivirga aquimarina TaxID=2027862 RepID=A0ABT8WB65_9FLAO|nr:hypothetical protein [Flavivirga aquimarina]MDO5970298.1 hypothetical protein [Flavivirga aquimarina]
MGTDKDNNSKEDHLSPTEINKPNHPEKDNHPNADLSHEELQERIDLYEKMNKEEKQSFNLQKIKNKYLKEMEEREINRNKGALHYGMGVRSDLPHKDYEDIKDMHNDQDRKLRNDTLKEAKEPYRAENSLEKSFKEKHPLFREGIEPSFNKAKDMDR